ncbi:MAG: site-2 protease family protein [Candidatus Bathyarchaeia archaeon]
MYAASKVLPFKKYGLEMNPLVLMFRTSRFNDWLDRAAKSYPKFWRAFSNVAIPVAGLHMVLAVYLLASNLWYFVQEPGGGGAVIPFVPGITVDLELVLYWLIPLGIVLVCHELAHGVIARREGITVKSSGLLFAFILWGAFVEPDEEELKRAPARSKLRVLAGGVQANIVVSLITLLLLVGVFQGAEAAIPYTASVYFGRGLRPLPPTGGEGIVIYGVNATGPASEAGLQRWDIIYAVNDTPIGSVPELEAFLKDVEPGDVLLLRTSRGDLSVQAARGQAYRIGASFFVQPYFPIRFWPYPDAEFSFTLFTVIAGTQALNLAVAIFNMLPLYPLDGGVFLATLTGQLLKSPKKERYLRIAVNLIAASIFFANIGFSLFYWGFFLTLRR